MEAPFTPQCVPVSVARKRCFRQRLLPSTIYMTGATQILFIKPSMSGYRPHLLEAFDGYLSKTLRPLGQSADNVLFITPEYNHTLTAIQKNALDSLGSDWANKPVTAVAYGWSGGSLAIATLIEVLENLKADAKHNMAQLGFMKDINVDGTILDEASVSTQIAATIDEIA